MVIAPGAYDGITARAVEAAGFPAVYMTGAGTAATMGFPDYGLLGMTEMAENVGRLCSAVRVPVIADADTGYGNELNVTRTVREYTLRGAAALHIEDQVFPKRCGHLDNKQVIPAEQFISKIRAAVEARTDEDLVIIARTDARAVVDLDEAVERANRALAAGADMAFVEAPQTLEEVYAVPRLVEGPCLLNAVAGGKTPPVTVAQAAEAGYRLVILPVLLLGAVVRAVEAALAGLQATEALEALAGLPATGVGLPATGVGLPATGAGPPAGEDLPLVDLFRRFGTAEWDQVRSRFPEATAADPQRARPGQA